MSNGNIGRDRDGASEGGDIDIVGRNMSLPNLSKMPPSFVPSSQGPVSYKESKGPNSARGIS